MTPSFALKLVARHEDAGTAGDPNCPRCRGDGSIRSLGGAKRCPCRDRLEQAHNLLNRPMAPRGALS
jgi:hypothetical protein